MGSGRWVCDWAVEGCVRGGHWHALQSKCIEELNVGALDEPSKVCDKDPPLLGRQSAILALLLDLMILVLPHRSRRCFRTCSKSKKNMRFIGIFRLA